MARKELKTPSLHATLKHEYHWYPPYSTSILYPDMNKQSFRLLPFGQYPALDNTTILGTIVRLGTTLSLTYTLGGNLDRIAWPPTRANPQRKDELWLETCFEVFIALPGQEQYWEFNFAPCGDWNSYHFSTYRRRTDLTTLPQVPAIRAVVRNQQATLHVDAPLPAEISATDPLQIGIASVVKDRDGSIEYFALTHQARKPDYHLRSSFVLAM